MSASTAFFNALGQIALACPDALVMPDTCSEGVAQPGSPVLGSSPKPSLEIINAGRCSSSASRTVLDTVDFAHLSPSTVVHAEAENSRVEQQLAAKARSSGTFVVVSAGGAQHTHDIALVSQVVSRRSGRPVLHIHSAEYAASTFAETMDANAVRDMVAKAGVLQADMTTEAGVRALVEGSVSDVRAAVGTARAKDIAAFVYTGPSDAEIVVVALGSAAASVVSVLSGSSKRVGVVQPIVCWPWSQGLFLECIKAPLEAGTLRRVVVLEEAAIGGMGGQLFQDVCTTVYLNGHSSVRVEPQNTATSSAAAVASQLLSQASPSAPKKEKELGTLGVVSEYLKRSTWRGAENANSTFSLQGLMQHVSTTVIADYWLRNVYGEEVLRFYKENRFHIHDLGYLSSYCCGWSVEDILRLGFGGVENKIQCRPANHLNTALNQIVNFMFTLQGELAGAQAVSNLDTYLAPFIRKDHLTQAEVFKCVQSFVYSLNVPTRSGFQAPFTNVSLDVDCPKNLKDRSVIIGGEMHPEWVYGDFQEEMDMFNRAFTETMLQGDGNGSIFSFPIPTYNISKDFDWESPRHRSIWEMTAKYGIPYFANFVNSDLNPEDFRSMCCRLRLDVRKLHSRSGSLFGSAPLTGSIGVVTLNLPNLAIRAIESGPKDKKESFYAVLKDTLRVAKDSLEVKRKEIEQHEELYPYASFYLSSIKERTGSCWKNHFSTIGVNGMNEALDILTGQGIARQKDFAMEVLEFIREQMQLFQEETGNLYNLEATPAESTSYKLAQRDRELFPNHSESIPEFYTNSTALPVDATDDMFAALDHQTDLQCSYTGGTVFHAFLGEKLDSWTQARDLIHTITNRYRIPYVSLTPTFSVCRQHGYISGEHDTCSQCGAKTLIYSRIVGYYRPVRDWNNGKKSEFSQRKYYKLPEAVAAADNQALAEMKIGGMNKLTMTDYPGKMAAIVFTPGCNLRCGWCHNGDLASGAMAQDELSAQEVVEYIKSTDHKNLVVSGGEPTLQKGLVAFLRALKAAGVSVKLDTNGTAPDVVEQILQEKLVDFVAMDLKCNPERYNVVAGVAVPADNIRRSVEVIKKSGIAHQFRTTVVPGMVDVEDIACCKSLAAGSSYVLQRFRNGNSLLGEQFRCHKEHSQTEFDALCQSVKAL